jgi:hypothetical protein
MLCYGMGSDSNGSHAVSTYMSMEVERENEANDVTEQKQSRPSQVSDLEILIG